MKGPHGRVRHEVMDMDEVRFLEFLMGIFSPSVVEVDKAIVDRLRAMKDAREVNQEGVEVVRTLRYKGPAGKVVELLERRSVQGSTRVGQVNIIENFEGGTYVSRNSPSHSPDPPAGGSDPKLAT